MTDHFSISKNLKNDNYEDKFTFKHVNFHQTYMHLSIAKQKKCILKTEFPTFETELPLNYKNATYYEPTISFDKADLNFLICTYLTSNPFILSFTQLNYNYVKFDHLCFLRWQKISIALIRIHLPSTLAIKQDKRTANTNPSIKP